MSISIVKGVCFMKFSNDENYIGIRYGGNINELYNMLTNFATAGNLVPFVGKPYNVQVLQFQSVIPVYCETVTPLGDQDKEWFFVFVTDAKDMTKIVPLYSTISFKKFVYNLLRNVRMFGNAGDIWPVLELGKVFIDNDNEIIFSEYKKQRITENDPSVLATYLVTFLKDILAQKGPNSPTLAYEINQLCQWVTTNLFSSLSSSSSSSAKPIDEALDESFFWTPAMKIDFIYLLDEVDNMSPGISDDAFLVDGSRNWFKVMENWSNPILKSIFTQQNAIYEAKANDPNHSALRVANPSGLNPFYLLLAGVKRVRDGCGHCSEHYNDLQRVIPHGFTEPISEITIQGLYQQYFPRYIVELAKSKHLTSFDPKSLVKDIFESTYIPMTSN